MLQARLTCTLAIAIAWLAMAGRASAQACCAGASAVTPARLALHEEALLGVLQRTVWIDGSFDTSGRYIPAARRSRELDLEQDLFGAVRVLEHGQIALLAPLVETYRRSGGTEETGGGIGDINMALRYDFYPAGRSRYLPGIGWLGGVTLPTGTPPDSATKPLATDATGLGATQAALGLALEQVYGPWLLGATGLVSMRTPRSARGVQTALAPQVSGLASAGYVTLSGASVSVAAQYAVEADASIHGERVSHSGRRLLTLSLGGQLPLGDTVRLLGSIFVDPPASSLSQNEPARVGITTAMTWSKL